MSEDVIGKVAALPILENDALKKLWRELFGEPAPRKKRDYLISRLAWRIQELAYGGLTDKAQDRINRLVRSKEKMKPSSSRMKRPAVGTKLIREYQGIEHHVTVARNGFEYQDRTYRSLSHVAREITGTRWSGPLFFGLSRSSK
ncbi:bacteriophage-related protein [methanotrophic bacterial endosymbiont of Bathymodiolus sp.]|nr:bacteriophage-related protein [methanotrophic bacterial endosymbiont of Bathymodiolus sp.]